jgi:hypothetical protein
MSDLIKYTLSLLVYLFLQVFLFNQLTIFQVATPFVFLLFLFTLPFDLSKTALYLLTFGVGLLVDVLSESSATGLHAFSGLLAISLRELVFNAITSSNVRSGSEISIRNQNTIWLVSLLLPLIFVHHLVYFYLEAMSFQHFFYTLLKVISSTAYTFSISLLIAYLFYKR